MEEPIIVRKVDALGRIALPTEVCAKMGWYEKSAVEIFASQVADVVILKTYNHACTYCGTTETLKEFNGRYICLVCQGAISKL